MIYLGCFGLSALFAYLANRFSADRKKFWLFSVISVLIPVLLAGLRGYHVGIDTYHYLTMDRFWEGAINAHSLTEYLASYVNQGYKEPLFALLIGVTAQYTGHYSVFLTLAHLIILCSVYVGAFRLRQYTNPVLVWILFFFTFFGYSLNGIRQFMAIAITFAFFADVIEKRYFRFIVAVIIATFIHNTAIISLGILVVHWLLYTGTTNKGVPGILVKPIYRQIAIVAALTLLVCAFKPLCQWIIDIGILDDKYLYYLRLDKVEHATIVTLYLLLEIGVLLFFAKRIMKKTRGFDYFITMSLVYLVLMQLTAVIAYGKRVAIYYSLVNLATVAMIPSAFENRKWKIASICMIVGAVFVYWAYIYAYRNASGTFPYVFFFNQ